MPNLLDKIPNKLFSVIDAMQSTCIAEDAATEPRWFVSHAHGLPNVIHAFDNVILC